jgi:hypothetical protein
MHHLKRDLNRNGTQAKGDWQNAEFRDYRFWAVGHEEATLEECEDAKCERAGGADEF